MHISSNILARRYCMLIALQDQNRLPYHYLVDILLFYFVDYIYFIHFTCYADTLHLIVVAAGLRWGRCWHRLNGCGVMT